MTREQKVEFVHRYCAGRHCDKCAIHKDKYHRLSECNESADDVMLDHNVMLVAEDMGLELCDVSNVECGTRVDDDDNLIIIKCPSGRKVDNISIYFKEDN